MPKAKPHKVKAFKAEWLRQTIDGQLVSSWCLADPTDAARGRCTVCPAPNGNPTGFCSFSIAEGTSAIQQHFKTKRHQEATKADANHNNEGGRQISIETGMKNQVEINKKQNNEDNAVLKGQIMFSNMLHHHGVPSQLFTCFADSAPLFFPDSNIAKKWSTGQTGFRQTKGDYFATHGIYPYQLRKLAAILQKTFFSINFDETSINGETQLDVNVSFMNDDGNFVKENLMTIDMRAGTSAEEVTEIVFGRLEELRVPLEHIIQAATDGCTTMLGSENGVHAIFRSAMHSKPII
jgi:hypothetical protein